MVLKLLLADEKFKTKTIGFLQRSSDLEEALTALYRKSPEHQKKVVYILSSI